MGWVTKLSKPTQPSPCAALPLVPLRLDSPTNIKVLVQKSTSGDQKVVCAKNLCVDDRRFCCSWPWEESVWFSISNPPLVGSQTDAPLDVDYRGRNKLHL
ncbi:hypothetical protein AgCh_002896 [Apium graveolens]